MRQLTFNGYLEAYVAHLSGKDTTSLADLAALLDSNPRLLEPLMLWAVVSHRSALLAKFLEGDARLTDELAQLVTLETEGELGASLADESGSLRPEYHKVWRSYVVRRDAHLRDDDLKLAVRKRVLELEPTRGVSRYRMAKDLGLNAGNLHAFLGQGNTRKLSLVRAYQLLEYLESTDPVTHLPSAVG